MADNITMFKPLTEDDVFKGIDKTYSTVKLAFGDGSAAVQTVNASEALTWYYVDRIDSAYASDDLKNLFHSFGISREDQDDYFKIANMFDWYNAKRMAIATIPQSGCGSYIDGSTVRLNVPWGISASQYTTFYGSSFGGYPDPTTGKQVAIEHGEGQHYGSAVSYLYANTNGPAAAGDLPSGTYASGWIHPYTGNVNGGPNPNSGATSFDQDDEDATLSDWEAELKLSPHLSASHWPISDDGHDVPYGIAFLEKGIFVIFDMYGREDFIGNTNISGATIWEADSGVFGSMNTSGVGPATDRDGVIFTGTIGNVNAKLTYRTVTEEYKMIYFCHAGQSEFNSTTNHTYNHKKAYFTPDNSDSLYVTEVALYDDDDTVLAMAKLSEPVEKSKLETLTFKVELKL